MLGHVLVVTVVVATLSGALICPLDIAAPEEKAVHDEGTDLEKFSWINPNRSWVYTQQRWP